jgi:hypothetical protein
VLGDVAASSPTIPKGQISIELEPELELIQTQMVQKPMLREKVHARALRASKDVERAEPELEPFCVGGRERQ